MKYGVDIDIDVRKLFRKIQSKDKATYDRIIRKIQKIRENPYQSKPLKSPFAGYWRTQIGSSILLYRINEGSKMIFIVDYSHHDEAYKKEPE